MKKLILGIVFSACALAQSSDPTLDELRERNKALEEQLRKMIAREMANEAELNRCYVERLDQSTTINLLNPATHQKIDFLILDALKSK